MPSPFPNPPFSTRGHLHCLEIDSALLKGNYWGDPHSRELWVYTPSGYDGTEPLPVVVFLAGFAGVGEGMLSRSLTDISLASRCDGWMAAGCPPFIAAFPDCMTYLGGSQFVDSPAVGRYAGHVIEELVPFIGQHFNTSGRLGLAGRSSGGYGALRLAMENPDAVHGVACHAGDMGFRTAFLGEITAALAPLHKAGSPRAFLKSFWNKSRFGSHDFSAFNLLCMSACYSPNMENGFPADLPLDIERGEVNLEVFERWMVHDPVELIQQPEHRRALAGLDHLFLDVGRYDEYNLQFGARLFVEQLQRYGIDHSYEEFDGGHRGTAYRYDSSIPGMVTALSGSR